MPNSPAKLWRRVALTLAVIAVAVALVKTLYESQDAGLPPGFTSGNGRLEADQVDIATKQPARVLEVRVEEGDLVEPGQVLAVLDSAELRAQHAMVRAESARAEQAVVEGEARVMQCEMRTRLAERELERAAPLVASGAVAISAHERLQTDFDSSVADSTAAAAQLLALKQTAVAARAHVDVVQALISDCTLRSSTYGRILYRLSEPGEVVPAGGTLLTILDLTDIYMEIFLSAASAARLPIGGEARIKLDFLPEYTIPATVVFVAPEAQFTPKHVETLSERESLMFRVKVRIPRELIRGHIDRVKTGVRGVAYVRVEPDAPWPAALEVRLPDGEPAAVEEAVQAFASDGLAPGG